MSKNKIILIDDNSKGSRELYGGSYVDNHDFSSILQIVDKLDMNSDLTFIKTASIAMFHDSLEDFIDGRFNEHSHLVRELIQDIIDDENIPYVCFSDGHGSIGEYDSKGNIISLKKSDFYYRLKFFLEEYQKSGDMILNILAYGPEYDKVIITIKAQALLRKFSSKAPADTLICSDVMPDTQEEPAYLEELIDFAQPAIGIDYNGILELIDDGVVSVRHFRNQISSIINSISSYGKNTYTWQQP